MDEQRIEKIFAYNQQVIDIEALSKNGIDVSQSSIYFNGTLLTGASESQEPYNEYFFGESDSSADNSMKLDPNNPIYQFFPQGTNNSTGMLNIILLNNKITLLNYSLADSSLNIKLQCNSKESQELLEKEQAQREQEQANNEAQSSQSTSMLHPVLEDNEIKCPHNGVVKLQANKGKPFTSNGIPMILESDLLNASITGCTNPVVSGGPCTSVAIILPSARGLKKYNDDYPIMQDLVASGCLTDKGLPLVCTPKENTLNIFDNKNNRNAV